MKPLYILLLTGLLPVALFGQSFGFPTFAKSGRSVNDFVPARWSIKDSVSGDLNRDSLADVALVLEFADTVREMRPDNSENLDHPRILLILFRDKATGGYFPVCQNNTFILRTGEGGQINDPYGSIGIQKNVLTVHFEFLHAATDYKFRWQTGDMFLVGCWNGGESGGVEDDWDFNFSTKKANHVFYKTSGGNKHSEWKTFELPAGGIRLRNMQQPYMLEIMKNTFI